MSKVIREGDTFRIKAQGYGDMTMAGAGEQHLLSMFGALGLPADDVQEVMDRFIEPADGHDS